MTKLKLALHIMQFGRPLLIGPLFVQEHLARAHFAFVGGEVAEYREGGFADAFVGAVPVGVLPCWVVVLEEFCGAGFVVVG